MQKTIFLSLFLSQFMLANIHYLIDTDKILNKLEKSPGSALKVCLKHQKFMLTETQSMQNNMIKFGSTMLLGAPILAIIAATNRNNQIIYENCIITALGMIGLGFPFFIGGSLSRMTLNTDKNLKNVERALEILKENSYKKR